MNELKERLRYYECMLQLTQRAKIGMNGVFDSQEIRLKNEIDNIKKMMYSNKRKKERKRKNGK